MRCSLHRVSVLSLKLHLEYSEVIHNLALPQLGFVGVLCTIPRAEAGAVSELALPFSLLAAPLLLQAPVLISNLLSGMENSRLPW